MKPLKELHYNIPFAISFLALSALLLASVSLTGCNGTDLSAANSSETGTKKLPKLYLHCPKEFGASITRMREIHGAISSEDALPEPIVCKVVEVVHGQGAGAHSHYHLAGQKNEHDHEESSDEKTHDILVDIFTEFRDIASVLPKVASDSDMDESSWNAVKKASGEIVDLFDDSILTLSSTSDQRSKLTENKEQIGKLLVQLEAVPVPTPTTEDK